MENTLKVPLREQENLKELFRLLEEKGMEQEKKQVLQMADYIDGMEEKMDEVMNVLTAMQEQLSGIENKSIRARTEKVVESVAQKAEEAHGAIHNLKSSFLSKVNLAVQAGKEKGREVMAGILRTIRLPEMTSRVQHLLRRAIASADHGIDQLGTIADDIHAAKQHLGNAGRALTGRKIKKVSGRDPEKGVLYETQRMLYQSMVTMKRMDRRTENLLERMDRLVMKDDSSRTSVRESIQELRSDRLTVQEPVQKQRNEPARG